MNSRAQEVRQKRLKARERDDKLRMEHEAEIEAKAENLFEWVLALLENSPIFNIGDIIRLYKTVDQKIGISYCCEHTETDQPFEDDVMKRLAKKFDEEEGYFGKYGSGPMRGYAFVLIRIE